MKLLSACFALIAVSEAVSFFDLVVEEWNLFKVQHKKNYSNDVEEKFRMKIFMENKNKIAKHNARYERGLVNYTLGMNHYGDMLHHEFVKTMNGFKRTRNPANSFGGSVKSSFFVEPANVVVAASVDWRTKGAVTPIKDQGHCGSCWAFSTTGSLEGQHFRKTGKLVSLSEQNLIDCSKKFGNDGCQGGLMDNAFKYIKDNHGLDTESSYPYEGEDDVCRYKPEASGATDTGFVDLPEGDEDKMKKALATVGPISIAIDASHETFQFYKTGVYYEPECSSTQLDHGVLAVGYGTESGTDYWLVKNSWGEIWGDEGYIKMIRNKDNNCGVASSASYPLV